MPKGPHRRMIVPWGLPEITLGAPWNFLQEREVGGKAEGEPVTVGLSSCRQARVSPPPSPFSLFFPEGRGGHQTGHTRLHQSLRNLGPPDPAPS